MRNLTLMTDFYELTMMYGYFKCGDKDKEAVFALLAFTLLLYVLQLLQVYLDFLLLHYNPL